MSRERIFIWAVDCSILDGFWWCKVSDAFEDFPLTLSWEHCVPSDTARALWGLGYRGCYSVLYIHCGTVSTLFLVFGTQQLPSYCTVLSRALLLAAWLVPDEGASTAGKRSGTKPEWEVVKNGCEFAREASPPTLGQAAGMEVRPDSGTPPSSQGTEPHPHPLHSQ